MSINEFINVLRAYVEIQAPNYQDGDAESYWRCCSMSTPDSMALIMRPSRKISMLSTQP